MFFSISKKKYEFCFSSNISKLISIWKLFINYVFEVHFTPSWNEPPGNLLALKKWALGARRSALGWGSLIWALGKIEWSAVRTALGWSFLWAVGAWHSEEVVWLILGFHSCVFLLRVFSYPWESVTVKVLSLIRKQSIGHCLF